MKESKLHAVLTALIDIVWLGVLWTLCSLPVVTLGASSTALYYTMVKCVRHDFPEPTHAFFRAFRQNFKQATLLWLVFLLALCVGIADVIAFGRMGVERGSFLYGFSRALLLPLPVLAIWSFAYLSRFDDGVKTVLRFGLWLAIRHWKQSLLLLAEFSLVALICWLLPQIAPLLPGALCLLMSFAIEPALRELSDGKGRPDDWYNSVD